MVYMQDISNTEHVILLQSKHALHSTMLYGYKEKTKSSFFQQNYHVQSAVLFLYEVC